MSIPWTHLRIQDISLLKTLFEMAFKIFIFRKDMVFKMPLCYITTIYQNNFFSFTFGIISDVQR